MSSDPERYLDGAGAPARRRNGVVRRREPQFGMVHRKVAAFEIEQSARAAEIVQQMAIDVEQIGFIAYCGNGMLVPDFGQQRTAWLLQRLSCLWLLWPAASAAYRVLHGLYSGLRLASIKAQQTAIRRELRPNGS